jgi:hypothetical protein
MRDKSLRLKISQERQYCGVRKLILETLADLADRCRTMLPKNLHEFGFALSEHNAGAFSGGRHDAASCGLG